jgi:hypothetical protein
MCWIKDGETIQANYLGVRVKGIVESSRVKYGGMVQYTVNLEEFVQFPWRSNPTNRVLITQDEIIS